MMMRLKYDLDINALYIKLSDHAVARTREIDDNTSIDLDGSGAVVGIEVVSTAHPWAFEQILNEYVIPAAELGQLRAYFQPAVAARAGRSITISIDPISQSGLVPETPALTVAQDAPVCVGA
jgi:uncharacterized protein YuzE